MRRKRHSDGLDALEPRLLLHGGAIDYSLPDQLFGPFPPAADVASASDPLADDSSPDATGAPGARQASVAPNLATVSMRFIHLDQTPVAQVITGVPYYVEFHFTTQDLPSDADYSVSVNINGDNRQYDNITTGAGLGGPFEWYYLFYFQFSEPGDFTAVATLDVANDVAESNETDNTASLPFTAVRLPPPILIQPMSGQQSVDYFIVNYVDVDPGPGASDYRGGPFTYDGHTGIDFTLPNFSVMDQGYPVYAAADGDVIYMEDGYFDRRTVGGFYDETNFVTIDHGNGWWTEYLHLRRDSITVQLGDHVTAGQVIGQVGSSGNSTAAHLHFSVLNGDPVATYLDPDTYWIDPLPYQGDVNTVLTHGVTSFQPNEMYQGEVSPGDDVFVQGDGGQVWLWNTLSTTGNNTIEVPWYQPDGTEYRRRHWDRTDPLRGAFWWAELDLPTDAALGQWEAGFEVDGVELSRTPFNVVPAGQGVPKIRIDQGAQFIVNGRTSPIDFGQVDARAVPPVDGSTQTFTVTNYGEVELTPGPITVPLGFAVDEGLPGKLAPGASDDFTIRLTVDVPGYHRGKVTVASNDADPGLYSFDVEGSVTGIGYDLDVDGNGIADPLTDGVLAMRYLFGFRGDALIADAVDLNPDDGTVATRTTPAEIVAFLDQARVNMLDVDGNGSTDALTDSLMISRYLFGFRGNDLTDEAVAPGAPRNTPAAIEEFVAAWLPPPPAPAASLAAASTIAHAQSHAGGDASTAVPDGAGSMLTMSGDLLASLALARDATSSSAAATFNATSAATFDPIVHLDAVVRYSWLTPGDDLP